VINILLSTLRKFRNVSFGVYSVFQEKNTSKEVPVEAKDTSILGIELDREANMFLMTSQKL